MRQKKRFNVLDYVDYFIAGIIVFIGFTIIFIAIGVAFGLPWLIDIIEQLVSKL